MATLGMRHAVLWVSDPEASATFYQEALGLERMDVDFGVFLSSPSSNTDHDLALFPADEKVGGSRNIGLYHIAWEVETIADLIEAKARLHRMGALVGENNHGVTRSLYCQDPDGIEFEIMWEVPLDMIEAGEPSNIPLDLEADAARFGRSTPGRGATVSP